MLNLFLWNTFAESLSERWTWNPSTDGKWSLVSILSRRPLMVQLEACSGMIARQHRPLGYTSDVSSNERATYWAFSDSLILTFVFGQSSTVLMNEISFMISSGVVFELLPLQPLMWELMRPFNVMTFKYRAMSLMCNINSTYLGIIKAVVIAVTPQLCMIVWWEWTQSYVREVIRRWNNIYV